MSINAQKWNSISVKFLLSTVLQHKPGKCSQFVTKVSWHASGQLYIYFTLYPQIVYRFTSLRYCMWCKYNKLLGLHIDKDLNWKTHIQNLLPKLSSACYLIRRMYPLFNIRTLKMIYHAYFHSVMEFGMFWGASAESRKVFLLQKRILQVMTGSPPRATCRTLFCKLGILTMVAQYVLSLMRFLASNLELFTFNTSVHGINTRTSSKLHKPSVRLKLNQQGPYNSCVNIYNKLLNDLAILITNKKLFLKQLRIYRSTKPIYSLDELFGS